MILFRNNMTSIGYIKNYNNNNKNNKRKMKLRLKKQESIIAKYKSNLSLKYFLETNFKNMKYLN